MFESHRTSSPLDSLPSLVAALSWGDASLVAPASASLTYICSAILAKFLLHENVDRRRWLAVIFVCVGVYLLSK